MARVVGKTPYAEIVEQDDGTVRAFPPGLFGEEPAAPHRRRPVRLAERLAGLARDGELAGALGLAAGLRGELVGQGDLARAELVGPRLVDLGRRRDGEARP